MRSLALLGLVSVLTLSLSFVGCGSSGDGKKGDGERIGNGQSADQTPSRCPEGKNLWEGQCWDSFTLDLQDGDFSLTLHRGGESREIMRLTNGFDPAIFPNFDCSVNPGTTVCVLKDNLEPAVITAVSFDTSTRAILSPSFGFFPEKEGERLLNGTVIERDKRLSIPFMIPNDHPESTILFEVKFTGYRVIYGAGDNGSVEGIELLAPLPPSVD